MNMVVIKGYKMGFTLIQEDTLYKKMVSSSGGSYINGVWIPGTETISYVEILGLLDPYTNKSEESLVLPEGVSSESSFILYSDELLNTNRSLPTGSTLADIVYITDPETDTSSNPYTVWSKSSYSGNGGFTLIDNTHYMYLLIREDRV